MEILGVLMLVVMIFGGGYALFKANQWHLRLFGLFMVVAGIGICCLWISSPSPEDDDDDYYESSYDEYYDDENDYDSYGGNGPSFRGGPKKCNIRSHNCTGGIDTNSDEWCDVCMNNGHKCHMIYHR